MVCRKQINYNMSGRYAVSAHAEVCYFYKICIQFVSSTIVHSRVHPGPVNRVHPETNKSGPTFANAAKRVRGKISVSSQVAGLKHERPQPKAITKQYDSELEQIYLQEWPDAVPKYKNKHRNCCCRDSERDDDSREILKKLFPPYVYCLLVFGGAIPPRSKACFYFVTALWILLTLWLCFAFLANVNGTIVLLICRFDATCQTADHMTYRQVDFSVAIANILASIPAAIAIILVHTSLRDQLQSRELRTLIASDSIHRIRNPEGYW